MKVLHIVPELNEANGVFVVARMLAGEDGGRVVDAHAVSRADVAAADEVWVHGMWLPCEWRACRMALKAGKRLVRMTHGSLSPVYLERQGKWKKRLVAPIERHCFAKCDRVVVTGGWEEEWCRKWGVKGPFETIDLKRFFSLKINVQSAKCRGGGLSDCQIDGLSDCCSRAESVTGQSDNQTISQSDNEAGQSNTQTLKHSNNEPLHLLYLGRRHPLKGVEYLEAAVRSLKFKVQSSKSGCRGGVLSDCQIDGLSDCCSRAECLTGQSDNQSISQSDNGVRQSDNQTIKQSDNEVRQSDNQTIKQSDNELTNSQLTTHNLQLKIVSSAFGDEKEKIWSWCDVLVLPTLSDNFGLVVAEALERGKRVITTDGAPAWGDGNDYGGRLVYLKGFRDGTDEKRVELLKEAIEIVASR